MSCQLQSQILMGKRFAFALVKMTIGGLADDADKMGAENYVLFYLVYSKQGNDCLKPLSPFDSAHISFVPHCRAGKDSKASEVAETEETRKNRVSHPLLSQSPFQILGWLVLGSESAQLLVLTLGKRQAERR